MSDVGLGVVVTVVKLTKAWFVVTKGYGLSLVAMIGTAAFPWNLEKSK